MADSWDPWHTRKSNADIPRKLRGGKVAIITFRPELTVPDLDRGCVYVTISPFLISILLPVNNTNNCLNNDGVNLPPSCMNTCTCILVSCLVDLRSSWDRVWRVKVISTLASSLRILMLIWHQPEQIDEFIFIHYTCIGRLIWEIPVVEYCWRCKSVSGDGLENIIMCFILDSSLRILMLTARRTESCVHLNL